MSSTALVPRRPVADPEAERAAAAWEARELGRLAGAELAKGVGGIGATHRAIAERAFRLSGPAARPAHVTHDAIAGGVYAAIRGASALAGHGAGLALARRAARTGARVTAHPRGRLLTGIVTGLIGDELERQGSPLAPPMAVRVDGRPVPVEPAALRAAFPGATRRIAVFLHGLMETEAGWRLGAARGLEPYGERLRRELGITPVELRYNTGRHISENGRDLAALLETLVAAWPVEVEQVALVGHSMGGLVARSACHVGACDGHAWTRRVRHVVSLGSPHMGAPLAQGVHLLDVALHRLPETRAAGRFLRRRSDGIRDLRHGSLVDEDWRDRDPHALRAEACAEVPLLEGATHCFVSATLTRSPSHPLGRLLGDLLVLDASACGRSRSRRIPFRSEHGVHVGGTHHLALLNHPQVADRLVLWLGTPPEAHVDGEVEELD